MRWLDWRIHGVTRLAVLLVPRPRFDLLVAMEEAADVLPVPLVHDDATEVLRFASEVPNN